VYIVGAGFQADAGDGARLPAEFRFGIDLRVEFLNRVNRNQRCRVANNCRGICHAESHERLIIGNAVDDVTGVLRADAVGHLGPRASPRVNRCAGAQGDEVLIVASIERQIIDNFVADSASQCGGGGVYHGDFLGDGNGLGGHAGLEHGVYAQILADFDKDVFSAQRP